VVTTEPAVDLPTRHRADLDDGTQEVLALLLARNPDDVHLAESIGSALRATGYGALRTIDVTVEGPIVYLVGGVPSYYLKQIAQETARTLTGVRRIHNDLNVKPRN
jgi:osmotically-inducible protein OsmY